MLNKELSFFGKEFIANYSRKGKYSYRDYIKFRSILISEIRKYSYDSFNEKKNFLFAKCRY